MVVRRDIPRDLGSILCALNLAIFLGIGLWLRVTSLETCPEPNGDEARYGVQAGPLVRGLPFAHRTTSRNPVNPSHVGFEARLLLLSEPWLGIVRVSAVAGGVAALGLNYPLMSRAWDRTRRRGEGVGRSELLARVWSWGRRS